MSDVRVSATQAELARVLSPSARAVVEAALADDGPVAFDADGTLWRGDVGEDLLRWFGATGVLPGNPPGVYQRYEDLVAQSPERGYAFAVEVMTGMEESNVHSLCARFFAERFHGRLFSFTRVLLSAFGSRVWIVSASPRWIVEAGARALGVDPSRVLGVDCPIEGGRLAMPVKSPISAGQGKVELLKVRGVKPVLAGGNGELDLPMLEYARRALVIAPHGDPGNQLVREAERRGWPVQRG